MRPQTPPEASEIPPTEALQHAAEAALAMARDRIELVRLEARDELQRRGAALALAALAGLLLSLAWGVGWASATLALVRFLPLDVSLAVVAAAHLVLALVCVWAARRRPGRAP